MPGGRGLRALHKIFDMKPGCHILDSVGLSREAAEDRLICALRSNPAQCMLCCGEIAAATVTQATINPQSADVDAIMRRDLGEQGKQWPAWHHALWQLPCLNEFCIGMWPAQHFQDLFARCHTHLRDDHAFARER